jgi:hypothetical protein
MSILNQRQLQNTRQKLSELEERCAAIKQRPAANPRGREMTVQSLNGLIKQLKEEIARYELRKTADATSE